MHPRIRKSSLSLLRPPPLPSLVLENSRASTASTVIWLVLWSGVPITDLELQNVCKNHLDYQKLSHTYYVTIFYLKTSKYLSDKLIYSYHYCSVILNERMHLLKMQRSLFFSVGIQYDIMLKAKKRMETTILE